MKIVKALLLALLVFGIVYLIFFVRIHTGKAAKFQKLFKPMVVAHRGGGGDWPENTIYAIKNSIETGADIIEVDVRMTKDNQLIAIHDKEVSRLASGSGVVSEMTWDEISSLDAGYWWTTDKTNYPYRDQGINFTKIEDILDQFSDTKFLVDIKSGSAESVINLCDYVVTNQMTKNVALITFDGDIAPTLREKCPNIITNLLPREINFVAENKDYDPKDFVPEDNVKIIFVTHSENDDLINKRLLKFAGKYNMSIISWWVGNPDNADSVSEKHFDGIVVEHLTQSE